MSLQLQPGVESGEGALLEGKEGVSLGSEQQHRHTASPSDPLLTAKTSSFGEAVSAVTTQATSAPGDDPQDEKHHAVRQSIHRRQGIRRWIEPRPLVGIAALLVTTSCVLFSFIVLTTSHGRAINTWPIQPTVYLAIAAAIANTAIGAAYAQATAIAWWYKAAKGTTLRTLERQWQASSSIPRALLYFRDVTLVAAATILVALAVADGPLLQRASSVISSAQSETVELSFLLAPEVPTGFSGERCSGDAATRVTLDWTRNIPMVLPVDPPCEGKCFGRVAGPGVFKTNCSTAETPITTEMWHDPSATWGLWPGQLDDSAFNRSTSNPVFYIDYGMHSMCPDCASMPNEGAFFDYGYLKLFNSSGKYIKSACWLVPAMLEYDAVFDADGHVRLISSRNSTQRLLHLANNTRALSLDARNSNATSTIDNFTLYLATFVRSNASASPPSPPDIPIWFADENTYNSQTMKYTDFSTSVWDFDFIDPTPDVIDYMNEMMFRAAIETASWANLTQLVDGGLSAEHHIIANQTATRYVFHSDMKWYWAAVIFELLALLAVVPLYWGWWTLDRHLDLSPFSTAVALDAPLFRQAGTGRGGAGVIEQLGDLHVRFGLAEGEETRYIRQVGQQVGC